MKVYMKQKGSDKFLEEIDNNIVELLSNPFYQGAYYFKDSKINSNDIPFEFPWVASNFGFTSARGGVSVINDSNTNYKLVHLSKPFLFATSDKVDICMLKLMDMGHYYLVEGSGSELMNKLNHEGYFLRNFSSLKDKFNFQIELRKEVHKKINLDFVKHVNTKIFGNRFDDNLSNLENELKENVFRANIF